MRRFIGVAAVAVAAFFVFAVAAAAATPPSGVTSNDFETSTAGWFDSSFTSNPANFPDFGTITKVQDGSTNSVADYADGVNSLSGTGTHYARLTRTTCYTNNDPGTSGPSLDCYGPYTDWGNLNRNVWDGPYTTQVDVYLDTAYAIAHPDVYGGNTRDGNIAGLSLDATPPGTPTDPSVPGTRFDFTSAINSSAPLDVNGRATFLRDFGFNVSTGTADDNCAGFIVNATTNVLRSGANPNAASSSVCIDQSGWYTFKSSFSENASHNLKVVMELIPHGTNTEHPVWTIENTDPISDVGCNRYGWFADQEIWGLPIDNSKIEGGCAGPTITGGQIAPTNTTCQAYNTGTAGTLDTVYYTLKDSAINSVSPGVFFYYGKITGTADQTFTITQTGGPPVIPIQKSQVILYDSNCNVVKGWTPAITDGVVTGTLPSTGTFIISVKYNPGALKGDTVSGTINYTFDGAAQVSLKQK